VERQRTIPYPLQAIQPKDDWQRAADLAYPNREMQVAFQKSLSMESYEISSTLNVIQSQPGRRDSFLGYCPKISSRVLGTGTRSTS
jgi:hypothetical protein